MADRELLELAAKAAGYKVVDWTRTIDGDFTGLVTYETGTWNPLADDGDALRLAVILRFDISPQSGNKVEVHNQWDSEETLRWAWASYGDDAMAATRRAIVQTAAAIGRDLP